jgi:hypothetical protein
MKIFERLLILSVALAIGCTSNSQSSGEKTEQAILWNKIAPFFTPPAEFKDQYGSFRSPFFEYFLKFDAL